MLSLGRVSRGYQARAESTPGRTTSASRAIRVGSLSPEKLWSALTDGEFMKQYWFGNTLRKPVDGGIFVEDGDRPSDHRLRRDRRG